MAWSESPDSHGRDMSVGEAKARLREWGVQSDLDLREQIDSLMSAARKTTRGVLPWAAGAAVLFGLFAGRGSRKDGKRGAVASGIGVVRSLISLLRIAAPFIGMFLARKRKN